jgi:ABC-type dipeptide/oligopeptide/nickel transport system permease component
MPNFWIGIMLILLFSVTFRILPAFGADSWKSIIMPAVTLGAAIAARLARLTRSAMLEVLGQDFIRVARAKGLATRAVLLRHALRNALIPIVTVLGLQTGFLLGGVVITEQIFGLPGLGWTLLNGVYQRDYPVVQGTVMVFAVTFVLVNLLVDLLYTYLDPRIRYE